MTDELLTSAVDVNFQIALNGNTILDEIYTPDSEQKIHIRNLGRFLENYLSGSFNTGLQPGIAKTFSFTTAQPQQKYILLCRAYTGLNAELFFGKRFLNLQYSKKITLPGAKEFLTAYFDADERKIDVQIFYTQNGVLQTSAKQTLFSTPVQQAGFYTVDASFNKIAALFPAINRTDIIAYSVYLDEIVIQYQVDRQTYLDAKQFIYLNSFGAPESLVCRGEIFRKGKTAFESAKIHGVEYKYDIERTDTFEVSSGKIYSQSEYALFREMFNAEEVKVFFAGEFRKIIISEENMNVASRKGNLEPLKFTFRFADPIHNLMLTDDSFVWVLEDGTWNDRGIWLGSGHWNDK
jgi:hypothetical protein